MMRIRKAGYLCICGTRLTEKVGDDEYREYRRCHCGGWQRVVSTFYAEMTPPTTRQAVLYG